MLIMFFGFLWNTLPASTPPGEAFSEETSDLSFTSDDPQPFIGPVKPPQLTESYTEANLPFWLPHWILPFITPTRYTELKGTLSSAAVEAVEVLIKKIINKGDPSHVKPSKAYWGTASRPEKFQGIVIINDRDKAKEFALLVYSNPSTPECSHRHVFWTDTSICGTEIAGPVVWQESAFPKKWAHGKYGRKCAPGEGPVAGEIMAIAMALEVAISRISQLQASLPILEEVILQDKPNLCHTVQVFSDSAEALQFISYYSPNTTRKPLFSQQARMVLKHTTTLRKMGALVELHLVPGHNGVPGNVFAHRVARKTAQELAQLQKDQEEIKVLQKTQAKTAARKTKITEERREKIAEKRARYKAKKKAKREMLALSRATASS